MSARSCEARLTGKQNMLVASEAAEIDLDMFGVELEENQTVAAFQIKKSGNDCCMIYKIYSVQNPPRLLRTITGGEFFNAADTDLDGRVEIWTNDGAAAYGLEGLRLSEIAFPPKYVLRFEQGRLLDVSSEFDDSADDVIDMLRAAIRPTDLQRFKASDGKLRQTAGTPSEGARLQQLRATKIQVLEIVWAYLYSGREGKAWHSLQLMWPRQDVQRIRSTIEAARAHGMRLQFDGTSNTVISATEKHQVRIYERTDKPAEPIMVRYYPRSEPLSTPLLRGKIRAELVVDCAGKVRSVKVSGRKEKEAAEYLKSSSVEWKFIPALVDNRPVASRTRLTLTLAQ